MELKDFENSNGEKITAERLVNLKRMVGISRDFHDGSTYSEFAESEYLRGQIEMIADFCGIDSDLAKEELPAHIFPASETVTSSNGYRYIVTMEDGHVVVEGNDGHTVATLFELNPADAVKLAKVLSAAASK